MNSSQALVQLQAGQKLKRSDWTSEVSFIVLEGDNIKLFTGSLYPAPSYLNGHAWEIYEEPDIE